MRFLFCQSDEGGMSYWTFSKVSSLRSLYGWMSKGCEQRDHMLLEFIRTAKIGEFHTHRLGVCIRIRDKDRK